MLHQSVAASDISPIGQTAWRDVANTLEIYDYLLHCGAHVDIANVTRHRDHYWKASTHPENPGPYTTYSIVIREGISHSPW